MDRRLVRTVWHRLETVNAVTYFSAECREASLALGLRGFWMGYFACRAAPMGPVRPGVVEATFLNFHPERVRRAIPAAWAIAAPGDLVAARAAAAATALRRLLPDGAAERLAEEVLPHLHVAIGGAVPAGRALFAANRDVPQPEDPVAALWQAATTLREHRGDAHVALLTAAGLDGCEVHVLFAACEELTPDLYQQSRGWSADDWRAAADRLAARTLVSGEGSSTAEGHALHNDIERRTDELAAQAYGGPGNQGIERLIQVLSPATDRIAAAGEISFPNPMGLPAPAPPA